MKIYIVLDMEGISGIAIRKQIEREAYDYPLGRILLTNEVNSAVEGAVRGGAKEIIVKDCHWGGHNLLMDSVHADADYIAGAPYDSFFQFMDNSFDGLIEIGFHSMAGTVDGIWNHTIHWEKIRNYYFNGRKIGEIAFCAIAAGYYDVPAIFLSGDKAAVNEAHEFFGDVETVAVKEYVGFSSAKCIAPVKANEMIRDGVERAVKRIGDFKPLKEKFPAEVKIDVLETHQIPEYLKKGWTREGSRTVVRMAETPDMML